MANFSSLVYCLWAWQGAYPIVKHLKDTSLGYAPALPTNIRHLARQERPARDKHSSLVRYRIKLRQ
jgi:hypothetical protein